jgi:ATP-binding cassette subfamily B (MDR/TAP) protein 1
LLLGRLLAALQGWCFGVMGQRLATRLRTLVLKSLLRQEAAFFDRPENASGALMSTLAGDAASVRGAVGDRLGVLFTMLSCIVASFTIAFYNR